MSVDRLQEALARLVTSCPVSALERLRVALDSESLTAATSVQTVEQVIHPERIEPHLLSSLLSAWREAGPQAISPSALAVALGSASRVRDRTRDEAPVLELVWTGPYPPSGGDARPTISVIREMLEAARQHILLVGYNLTAGSEATATVVRALADARARGCDVTIALHSDGTNHHLLTGLWPARFPPPRLLQWTGRPEDPRASLHAKVVAVDGRDLLVTSANLTYHGLESNIEVGVRVRGRLAWQVTRHFAALERDGILVLYRPQ